MIRMKSGAAPATAVLATVAALAGAPLASTGAAAADYSDRYQFCRTVGSNNECAYTSWQQCEASRTSGTSLCIVNPAWQFGQGSRSGRR